jgi:hypothetical protein
MRHKLLLMLALACVLPALVSGCNLLGLFGGSQEICPNFVVTGPLDGRDVAQGVVEFNWICGASDRTGRIAVSQTQTPFDDPAAIITEVTTDRHGAARVSVSLPADEFYWAVELCAGDRCERFPEQGGLLVNVVLGGAAPGQSLHTLSCADGPSPLCPTFEWSLQGEATELLIIIGQTAQDAFPALDRIIPVRPDPATNRVPAQGIVESPFCFDENEERAWTLWSLSPTGQADVVGEPIRFTARSTPPQLLAPADAAELTTADVDLQWDADIADDAAGRTLRVLVTPCADADSILTDESAEIAANLPAGTERFNGSSLGLSPGCWAWAVVAVNEAGEDEHQLRACPDCCETIRTFTVVEDCNANGVADATDIANGTSRDCQDDGVPDECQLSGNNCDGDRVPDECEEDCNDNGEPDDCEELGEGDCNENGVPDECEPDCNGNRFPDECDILSQRSDDVNGNGIPDECERLHVDLFNETPGNGRTWATAFNSLQDALREAAAPGGSNSTIAIRQIWVSGADGVPYRPDDGVGIAPGDRSASFGLLRDVAVYGGFCGSETQLDQRDCGQSVLSGDLEQNDDGPSLCCKDDNSLHVVTAGGTNAASLLDGFIIEGGFADGAGAAGDGGGMYNSGGSLVVNNCVFRENLARARGGAVANVGAAAGPAFSNCLFQGNQAFVGGAVFNAGVNAHFAVCGFSGNLAGVLEDGVLPGLPAAQGGAMHCEAGGNVVVSRSIFSDNRAVDRGGALSLEGTSPRVSNCLFLRNQAGEPDVSAGNGGAVAATGGSSPTFVNCTIWLNSASCGGAFLVEGGTPVVINSIVWENGGTPICLSDDGESDLQARFSDIQMFAAAGNPVWPGPGNINADPQFAIPCCGTQVDAHLCEFSPCLEAGNDADADSPVDLDGATRVQDNFPDSGPPNVEMGAYEGFVLCGT